MDSRACWRVEVLHRVLCTRVTSQAPDGALQTRDISPRQWQAASVAAVIREMCDTEVGARLPAGTSVRVKEAGGLFKSSNRRVALFVTKGHKDVIKIGTQKWLDPLDHTRAARTLDDLMVFEVAGRMAPDGECLAPLDEDTLTDKLKMLYSQGVRSVVVSFLHARTTPDHELRAAEIARGIGFSSVVLGHTIDEGRPNFLNRTRAAAEQAAQNEAAQQWVVELGSELQQFIDHEQNSNLHTLPLEAFETVTFDAGMIKIGADFAGVDTAGPACFGQGGPATVFDCALIAGDFAYLGIEGDVPPPEAKLLDMVAADTCLSNLLEERAPVINVPFGSPGDLARCVMSRVQNHTDLHIGPQIPPGAEEWLMEHIQTTLRSLVTEGCKSAAVAFMQDGVRARWLGWSGHAPNTLDADPGPDELAVTIPLHGQDSLVLVFEKGPEGTETLADDATGRLRKVFDSLGPTAARMVLDRIVMRSDQMFQEMLNGLQTSQRELAFDNGTQIKVAIRPDKTDGTLEIDFTGSSPRQGSMVTSSAKTRAAVLHALQVLCPAGDMLLPDVLSFCEITIPPQSNLAAEESHEAHSILVEHAVVTAVLAAFGAQASGQGCLTKLTFFGMENEDTPFRCEDILGGGAGATAKAAGQSGRIGSMLTAGPLDIETLERTYPLRIEECTLRTGSGGLGTNPGGDGLVRRVTILAATALQISGTNGIIAPFGLRGGMDGATGDTVVLRKNGTPEPLESRDHTMLSVGDQVVIRTPGGGGFG